MRLGGASKATFISRSQLRANPSTLLRRCSFPHGFCPLFSLSQSQAFTLSLPRCQGGRLHLGELGGIGIRPGRIRVTGELWRRGQVLRKMYWVIRELAGWGKGTENSGKQFRKIHRPSLSLALPPNLLFSPLVPLAISSILLAAFISPMGFTPVITASDSLASFACSRLMFSRLLVLQHRSDQITLPVRNLQCLLRYDGPNSLVWP